MEWMKDLKCSVTKLAYEFEDRVGYLWMAPSHSGDMMGCVALFRRIDPKVKVIVTVSGENKGTLYRKEENGWKAYMPKDA